MNSCIYNGIVTHHRFKPVKHSLKYNTFSLFVDLDELEKLHKDIKIFSFNKFNLFSFYNKDHGPRDGSSLKKWVLEPIIFEVCYVSWKISPMWIPGAMKTFIWFPSNKIADLASH